MDTGPRAPDAWQKCARPLLVPTFWLRTSASACGGRSLLRDWADQAPVDDRRALAQICR